ncbi:MAG: cobalamin-independent methionine synthase II family protein [Chloroflexi bacterium]|nr:cobalamin-independent methionine synthase II family protein [Chloroflexota bacterium]
MKRSTDRILTTHAGSLPRPEGLRDMVGAKAFGGTFDESELSQRIRTGVAEVVRLQVDSGIDIVNDGELSKTSFTDYVRGRFGGLDLNPDVPYTSSITGRDAREFPEYFDRGTGFPGNRERPTDSGRMQVTCTGPLTYTGQEAIQADIERFKAALQGVATQEDFLPSIAPGTIEHWLQNEHYPDDESFLNAIADAMHEEYKAITDAGLLLQIDDPDLGDGWQVHPDMTVPEYRKFAQIRVEAMNHALRGIPEDRVRLHVCWGSYHGPHLFDIPLKDILDLILMVNVEGYSIEASNPRHEHEWRVWEDTKLPDGKVLIPGVVGHATDFIEHPELVAQRLVRYARLVGRENVIAGTDCGLGTRLGHPKITWAKFQAMAEGAELATKELWGRS